MRQPKRKGKGRKALLITVASVLLLAGVYALSYGIARAVEKNGGVAKLGAEGSALSGGSSTSLASAPEPEPEPEPEPQPVTNTVKFSAVGDNLIHDGLYSQAQRRAGGTGYDFNYIYENTKYFFKQFDVNWINQESLVNNEFPASTYPMFSTPGECAEAAYDAGWRVFAVSNNHTYDKGAGGVAATRKFWSAMPDDVVVPGLFVNEDDADIVMHTVNGIKIAYLSFTDHTNGLPEPEGAEAHVIYSSETDKIERLVKRADELADAVVVGVHWEVENSHITTDAQRTLANSLVEWGADAIIGTHPHVIQGIEYIDNPTDGRKIPVAWSLGNFISAQSQPDQLIGICFAFDISQTVDPDGTRHPVEMGNVKAYPTITHYGAGYSDIRDYMFRDYTDELAAQHGVRSIAPGFNLDYIKGVLQEYIAPEFLVLD